MRRDARRSERRKEILKAARRVCDAGGPDALTMRAVAAEAGYVAGAVYSYFSGIDELALALVAEELGHLARRMKDASAEQPTPVGQLEAAVAAAREAFAENAAHVALAGRLIDAPAGAIPPDLDRALNGRLIAVLQTLHGPLRAASGLSLGEANAETVTLAALIVGLGILERTGRLGALGFEPKMLLGRHVKRLTGP